MEFSKFAHSKQFGLKRFKYVIILIICFLILIIFKLKFIFQLDSYSSVSDSLYFKPKCKCRGDQSIEIIKYANNQNVYSVYKNKDEKLYSLTKEEFENAIITCDMYNVLRRGKNQKVIGYSLYGKNRFYYDKLKDLTRQINQMYPGWIMRVYYDDSIDESIICDIECARKSDAPNAELIDNTDFCNVNTLRLKFNKKDELNADYMHKMKWRWFPIGDSFVDVFSSRDTDSFILQREIDSVNVWLSSKKLGHIMRDHPAHGTSILGGMWGFFNQRNRKLAKKIFQLIVNKDISSTYNKNFESSKGADQNFLNDYVYKHLKSNSIIHDSYLCKSYGGSAFPTKRIGDCFVGNPYSCNVSADSFYECPLECRPADHKDWINC
jgi:hypothetical protein